MAKILVVHGYVLSGTGSNLYVRNVVRKMCEEGQDVVLVCQEFTPQDYDFIAKCVKADGDNYPVVFERQTPYPGKCELYIPDTNNELLVYVYDRYGDFHVQEMKNVSEQEIQDYICRNAQTIQYICEHNEISKAYSNHLVLQPQYVAQGIAAAHARTRQIIIGHGSDINYAISKSAYLDGLSRETLTSCDQLVAVSQSLKQTMQDYYHDLDLSACKVIPAGLDERLYGDMPQSEEQALLEAYIDAVDQDEGFSARQSKMIAEMIDQSSYDFSAVQASYEAKSIEAGIKDELFNMLYASGPEKAIYLGKYLEQKGLILLILALPLMYAQNPRMNFILVGFGALRAQLEYIIQLIERDRIEVIFDHAHDLGITLAEDLRALEALKHFLSDSTNSELYKKGAALLRQHTLFTGYLDQEFAVRVLHSGKVSVLPSIYSEAFGMVIIEAMASQVRPFCTRHSGFQETLEAAVAQIPGLDINEYSAPLDEQVIMRLADKTLALLEADDEAITLEMSQFALSNYGWRGITQELLDL